MLVAFVGGHLLQLFHRPIPVCFKVDAYAAIHWTHGHVQVNVCNAHLDDFVQHFVGLLIICYSHSYVSAALTKTGSHASWEVGLHFLRQLEKAIPLSSVLVYHGNSIAIGIPRVALYNDVVQEIVVGFVLRLHQVRKGVLFRVDMMKNVYGCTYFSHATFEGNSAIVIENTFRSDVSIHTLVGVLVDERAQFSLNLELYSSARNFLHILVVDDMDEEKVGNVLG